MNHKGIEIYRAWINQPSTLQELHRFHGKYCIVVDDDKNGLNVILYFTEGKTRSIIAKRRCISKC